MIIPANVPQNKKEFYIKNKSILDHENNPFLFAVDHKIEHLHADFHGTAIAESASNTKNIFEIAQKGGADCLLTHLGLINQWGSEYPDLNYIIKMNGKTNLISTKNREPLSRALWTVEQVAQFQEHSNLKICGVAYTIYLGSEYENEMMKEAAQIIFEAHQKGFIALIFSYPRGKYVDKAQNHPDLVAGAAGVAASLGADFVKLAIPYQNKQVNNKAIKVAVEAAGRTHILFAGGTTDDQSMFLETIQKTGKKFPTVGFAIGRNIFQLPVNQAIEFSQKIKTALQR
jgi:fructose-bisphosphate aldolase/6-deoxy-5-ketofructose 1-phosphate synthase